MNYFQSKRIRIASKLVFVIIIVSTILPSYQILFAESVNNPQPQNARMMHLPSKDLSESPPPSGKMHQPYVETTPTLEIGRSNLSNSSSTQSGANALKSSVEAIDHPETIEPKALSANSDVVDPNILLPAMAPILALISFMAYKTLGRPIKRKIPANFDWFLHGETTQITKNPK